MIRINLHAFLILIVSTTLAVSEGIQIENRDGRMIEVTILGVRSETVRVKKSDGTEFEIQLSSLAEASVKRIKEMTKAVAPADGGPPPVKVHTEALSPAEQKLLEDLYPILRESRLSELRPSVTQEERNKLKEDCAVIVNSLAKIHSNLTVKDRCERLLAIIQGRLKGGSAKASLGAVSCLTLIKESEATDTLFEALGSNLFEGAELECHRGLGERCTGKVMEKALEMFMSSDRKVRGHGGFILADIQTKAQLAELKERANTVVNTAEAKDRLKAVYTLARNLKD